MSPRQYLESLGKPFVTPPDIARAMGVQYSALYARLGKLPEKEKPEAHGAFRAGGYLTMTVDAAASWAERHLAYWAEREATKKKDGA